MLSEDLEPAIEELIDRMNLQAFLEATAAVCYGKAEHVETNWQDPELAKRWERAGKACEKAMQAVASIGLD